MNEILWCGSESSYHSSLTALGKIEDYRSSHFIAGTVSADSVDGPSEYLQVIEGVGIVGIEGSLVDGTTGILGKWFGVTGYGDIAQALIQAVGDPAVGSILLNIKSPGGSVAGVQELGKFIETIDKIKPVVAYTGSLMASAALWLGVAARKIYASETAVVGSVGAMTVVTSRERQLKDAGIDAKVVRSGDKKALGHPVDPMTEAAIADAQDKVDYFAGIFLARVADRRGMSATVAKRNLASGDTFIGQQAKDVGLIDAVASYGEAFAESLKLKPKTDNNTRVFGAQVAASTEAGNNLPQAKGQTMPTTHIPTEEQLRAMLPAATTATTTVPATAVSPEAAAVAAAAIAATEAAAEAAAQAAAVEALAAVQTQLTEATASLTTAQARVAELEAQVAAGTAAQAGLQEVADGLTKIIKASMKGMAVALNSNQGEVDATEQAKLVGAYGAMLEKFQNKFKAGGVAVPASQAGGQESAEKQTMSPRMAEIAMSLPGAK